MNIFIFDKDNERRVNIENILAQYGKVSSYRAIEESLFEDVKAKGDICFLHANNDKAEKLYDMLTVEQIPVIVYTDGEKIKRWVDLTKNSIYLTYFSSRKDLDIKGFFLKWKTLEEVTQREQPLSFPLADIKLASCYYGESEAIGISGDRSINSVENLDRFFLNVSVLCMGYFAAHADELDETLKKLISFDALPPEMKMKVLDRKTLTANPIWWRRVLGQVTVENSLSNNKKAILDKISAIVNKDDTIEIASVVSLYKAIQAQEGT